MWFEPIHADHLIGRAHADHKRLGVLLPEEKRVFFNCLFLQKLPRELRMLLSEADMADKRLLSERAHNSHLHHDTVAAVSSEPDGDGAVAAVQLARGGQSGR